MAVREAEQDLPEQDTPLRVLPVCMADYTGSNFTTGKKGGKGGEGGGSK